LNPETEIPSNRIAIFGGIKCLSSSRASLESSLAVSMTATDLLRVINSKSENFTLSVAVRPRAPVASQWRQTLLRASAWRSASAAKPFHAGANVRRRSF
jgi:hypothetical protein